MTYGKIILADFTPMQTFKQFEAGIKPKTRKVWEVHCAPHIAMQLKRMFPVLASQMGVLRVSDTAEMCRGLAWFMTRYPMTVSPAEKLFTAAERHKTQEQAVRKLQTGEFAPSISTGFLKPLRPYQIIAGDVCDLRGGLLLADDTGTGKTASAIGMIVRAGKLPAVVVTLTALPAQWKAAIEEFIGLGLNVHVITSGKPYDLTRRRGRGKQPVTPGKLPDVILMSYSKLAGWAETLAELGIKLVVFDECQELRHDESDRWAGAYHLASTCAWRLGLSATPFYNYGGEFYNVAEVLSPGELGSKDEFSSSWCSTVNAKQLIKDPPAFHAYLKESGFMLRRTRKDVGREMPAVTKVLHFVDTDKAVFKEMGLAAHSLAHSILQDTEEYRGQRMQVSGQFDMIMRQATGLAKAPYVAEFVRMLLESEKNVVLFGWHRDVYDQWARMLAEFHPTLYTGTESPNQKLASLKEFYEGRSRVLMMSLRAGAGVDGLQFHTRNVVIGELDWSAGVLKQNIERVDRDGQPDPVMAYYMLSDDADSSDPYMMNALGIKGQQIEGVRDGISNFIEAIQSDGGHIRKMAKAYLERGKA